MKSLKNKRLLLLGGSMWKDSIKQFAEEHGIVLIATGNNPNAGIFQIADEAYFTDSTDNEAMKKLIVEKKIDGVYMGGSEPVISHACEYINELKLPCYCTKEQWDSLQNKKYFKELCIKHKLPVVSRYNVSLGEVEQKGKLLPFPIITKPTDGSGSSGFSVCRNYEDFIMGYKKASHNSESGEVIIEDFVNNNGIVVFYTICNGIAFFSGIEDKYPVKYSNTGSYVAGMHIFQSKCINEFRLFFENKIQELINDICITDGSIWIEVFYDGVNYFFNEAGFRYSGSVSIYPVNYFYCYNQVAKDIYFALTNESKLEGFHPLIDKKIQRKKNYCIYSIHLKPGEINVIDGIDEIIKIDNMVAFPVVMDKGHLVKDTGTISQVFGFLHFVFDTPEEWSETINVALSKLKILNYKGESLVNIMIDPNNTSLRSI